MRRQTLEVNQRANEIHQGTWPHITLGSVPLCSVESGAVDATVKSELIREMIRKNPSKNTRLEMSFFMDHRTIWMPHTMERKILRIKRRVRYEHFSRCSLVPCFDTKTDSNFSLLLWCPSSAKTNIAGRWRSKENNSATFVQLVELENPKFIGRHTRTSATSLDQMSVTLAVNSLMASEVVCHLAITRSFW